MNEHLFLQSVHRKASELHLNPLLLLSGIEGLYSFRDVPLNTLNFGLLDSLILTIFTLRLGDGFHELAEANLLHSSEAVRAAAQLELEELSGTEISHSADPFLQSFAGMLQGKTPVRRYHEKALEVAALEVKQAQVRFESNSIGAIVLHLCNGYLRDELQQAGMFG